MPNPPPDKFGGVSVLFGSTADITIKSTKPLRTAALERPDRAVYNFEPVDAPRQTWRLKDFPIDKSGSFHVLLTDTENLTNSQPPVEYFIDAKPDLPPTVKLLKARQRPHGDAPGKTPSRFQRLRRLRPALRLAVLSFSEQPDFSESQATTNFVGEVKRLEIRMCRRLKTSPDVKFAWDLSTLNVKPEDQLVFWLEADDDCPNENARPVVQPASAGVIKTPLRLRPARPIRAAPS